MSSKHNTTPDFRLNTYQKISLEWKNHVDVTAKKASNTGYFLQRNLKYCPKQVQQTGYYSLVRAVMEYSGAIWELHLQKDKGVN